jgi:hypothetical protein
MNSIKNKKGKNMASTIEKLELTDDWSLAIVVNEKRKSIDIPRPVSVMVQDEMYAALPDFNPEASTFCWQKGIPYMTLMTNNNNHPDSRGVKIFGDSLMEMFS